MPGEIVIGRDGRYLETVDGVTPASLAMVRTDGQHRPRASQRDAMAYRIARAGPRTCLQ